MKFIKRSHIVFQSIPVILILMLLSQCGLQDRRGREDKISVSDREIYRKVDSLMALMTLEEKIGQMSQRFVPGVTNDLLASIRNGRVGSLLNGLSNFYGPEERNMFQRAAVEGSRLGIPLIFGHDVIHGFRTIFPVSLAQSCTWSPGMVEQASVIAAREASASGVDWAFAPMIDVSKDPRWGRIAECYGEDPFLNAVFGAAVVKGFQGSDVSRTDKLVACLKHFIGYGAAMGGRDYQYTDIPDIDMHEVYMVPYKAGVEAGALTVMSAFNDINGIPATANEKLVRETLKDQWGFRGFVVSDWDAVIQLIDHGIAKDDEQAAIKTVRAGVDMEMKSDAFLQLPGALDEGKISEDIIDDAVRRILYVKFRKGLFEHPYTDTTRIRTDLLTPENRQFARKVARASMVLLKNEHHILPLSGKNRSVAVVGPFAKESELMGWWKSTGKTSDVVTPFNGMKENAPAGLTVTDRIGSTTDLIIACVGEGRDLFGENHSRSNLRLPGNQEDFLSSLRKWNKPVVTVVFNGRPLDLTGVTGNSEACLLAWHPGTEAGNALADVLYGNYNPSGKLTTSFPRSVGQIPVYYNHRNSGRPDKNKYVDETSEPLFPFGFGLSYTTFAYDSLSLSSDLIQPGDSLVVSALVSNTGNTAGNEIVQLYIRDLYGSTTRPVKELKGFRKIFLQPGESAKVSFIVGSEDLTVPDKNFHPVTEKGTFDVWVGPNSAEGLIEDFELTDGR